MSTTLLDQWLFFIYFIYGLAFFGMGLAMALESGRSQGLADTRVLRPLSFFGLIHGGHEWFEAYLILQRGSSTGPLPGWVPWLKIVTLVVSFIFLFLFAHGFLAPESYRGLAGWLRKYRLPALYWLLLGVWGWMGYRLSPQGPAFWDALARYGLAVPASLLAALALNVRSRQSRGEDRPRLAWFFFGAAVGFGIYAFAQIFVQPMDLLPANWVNQANFSRYTGIPIQLIRSMAAVLITYCMIRATQVVEEERARHLYAVQQSRLEALQQRDELRRKLLQHTVQAQEEERARIARELHDETAQVLSAFSLELAALDAKLRQQPQEHARVEKLQGLSRQVSQGLYRLVGDLRPAHLDDFGLVPAINYLLTQARQKGIEFNLQVQGAPRRLNLAVETVLFRVAQEAITNITRHSGAERARLELCFNETQVQLLITDQGRGFDPAGPFKAPRGWGLAGMRERVEAAGGILTITSAPGQGASLLAVIPLESLALSQAVQP